MTCKHPEKFIASYKKYSKSRFILFYLKDLLSFFEILSKNLEFSANEIFISELLKILQRFPKKDIIHFIVFKIFENQIENINNNPKILKIIIDFLLP